jgi:hypothetical protein
LCFKLLLEKRGSGYPEFVQRNLSLDAGSMGVLIDGKVRSSR